MLSRYRNIARVVKPHGRSGEVIVQALRGLPFCIEPGLEVALTPPALDRDRFCVVESVADNPQGGLVHFSGIDSIDAAEGIRGCYVLVRREDVELGSLDAPWTELIGRRVVDERFSDLGTVTQIYETPANDVWQVEGPYGEVLIPVVEQVVSEIPAEGDISVRIMDGLLTLGTVPNVLTDGPGVIDSEGQEGA